MHERPGPGCRRRQGRRRGHATPAAGEGIEATAGDGHVAEIRRWCRLPGARQDELHDLREEGRG
eukprot:125723-Chlamydomonas_euryale.AAC.1